MRSKSQSQHPSLGKYDSYRSVSSSSDLAKHNNQTLNIIKRRATTENLLAVSMSESSFRNGDQGKTLGKYRGSSEEKLIDLITTREGDMAGTGSSNINGNRGGNRGKHNNSGSMNGEALLTPNTIITASFHTCKLVICLDLSISSFIVTNDGELPLVALLFT